MMLKLTLALLTAGVLTGCASIVSDSTWPVTVNSCPAGASVTVKDQYGVTVQKATAPTTVMLPSGKGYFSSATYTFTFEKEGSRPPPLRGQQSSMVGMSAISYSADSLAL